MPVFLSIEKATPVPDHTANSADNRTTDDRAAKSSPYYPENMPQTLVAWVKSGQFCTENLTINIVAKQMNTNRRYLSAYLNRQLGVTFRQWLNARRVERAKKLFNKLPPREYRRNRHEGGYSRTV